MKRFVGVLLPAPFDDIFTYFHEDNIEKAHAVIIGPKDTPYQGGFFGFDYDGLHFFTSSLTPPGKLMKSESFF